MSRVNFRDERGASVVLFAVVLTTILTLGAAVVNLGNWWTHGKNLQTKVDAAALAAGGVWGFPCGADSDTNVDLDGILDTAREYVGSHTAAGPVPAAGTVVNSPFNAQVGGVPGDDVHVVMNGTDYWDDDSGTNYQDMTTPLGQVCLAKVLDVKATEANSAPLFGILPFWPDVKRKARIEIQEVKGLSGLLPIGVRIPKPLSAAAVFYNEDTGGILAARYFCEDNTIFGLPPGLGGWSTKSQDTTCTASPDTAGWAQFTPTEKTGVVIATSFRPRCGAGSPPAGPPCMNVSPALVNTPVDDFCRGANGTIQCDYATGAGSTQSVVHGLHFIRGYPGGGAPNGPPQLRGAHLTNSGCNPGNGYFNSGANTTCRAGLTVNIDLGSVFEDIPPTPPNTPEQTRIAGNVEVRYKLVRANGTTFCDYGPNCSLQKSAADTATGTISYSTQGTPSSPHLPITTSSRGNAVSIEVRLARSTAVPNPGGCGPANDFNNLCRWYYTGSGVYSESVEPPPAEILNVPIQRAFMGNLSLNGPIRWLRLTQDPDCDDIPPIFIDNEAATHSTSSAGCFFMDMGLQGGLARDQDEPPIALNLGDGSSQRALLDCDNVSSSNVTNEVKNGCSPSYAANPFTINGGGGPFCPNVNSVNGLLAVPKPPPFDDWAPYKCVITQTGTGNQVMFGFNQRLFGSNNAPSTCPIETSNFVPGRNYWHDANNANDNYTFAQNSPAPPRRNRIRDDDPRLVTLFFTPYNSFTSTGNEPFPIVGFGNFYITGYGRTTGGGGSWQGGGPEDPCDQGNVGNPLDGLPYGQGNEPPPDLDLGSNETWVWGHFVSNVVPGPRGTPSGVLCNPEASFQPCIPSLVE
jgi:Putative Flp pilus-assembly TadE/G-like